MSYTKKWKGKESVGLQRWSNGLARSYFIEQLVKTVEKQATKATFSVNITGGGPKDTNV